MIRRRLFSAGLALAAGLVVAAPAAGQYVIGVETNFRGFSLEDNEGLEVANLLLVPVAVRIPVSESLRFDMASGWARGQIEAGGSRADLSGILDTRIKTTWLASEWAQLSVTVNLPTGKEQQTANESRVRGQLANDLFGFRESNWGMGTGVTMGVSTATRIGPWGIGLGGSYGLRGEFEPSVEEQFGFQPGNEARVRLAVERRVGTSGTLSLGGTLLNYSAHEWQGGLNLFQPGNRILLDASYAFRAGSGTWTTYAAGIWRENGDLSASFVGDQNQVLGDTTIVTPSQNLIIAGVRGSIPVSGGYRLRPGVSLRVQSRDAPENNDEGSGWILGIGTEVPLRLFGQYDLVPRARFITGSIRDLGGTGRRIMGLEFGGRLRWQS